MASCPKCNSPIRLYTLLFSIMPIWIVCPQCRARLQGNLLVRFQAIVVIIFSFIIGSVIISMAENYQLQIQGVTFLLICGVLGVALPNALISLKWGQFEERD